MQAAALTDEPVLKAELGAVSAGEPDQWPSLPAGLGCPMGQESRNMGATSSTRAEVHKPGQTEGWTDRRAQQQRSWSSLVPKSGLTTKMEELPEDLGSHWLY